MEPPGDPLRARLLDGMRAIGSEVDQVIQHIDGANTGMEISTNATRRWITARISFMALGSTAIVSRQGAPTGP